RRTIPFSGGARITIPSGPHHYQIKTWIGSVSQGHTPQEVFESLSRNATPFQTQTSVNGGIVNVPGLGPVRQLVDPDHLTIVNTTEPEHLLHPGNVFRSVVKEGDDLYVVTQGYGTGVLPHENETILPEGWKFPDTIIRAELNNKKQLGYPMDELNAIAHVEPPPVAPSQSDRP